MQLWRHAPWLRDDFPSIIIVLCEADFHYNYFVKNLFKTTLNIYEIIVI